MENSVRIRINLSTKEFEVEGPEQFVKDYADKIENMLSGLTGVKVSAPAPDTSSDSIGSQTAIQKIVLPETFGEYLHLFPKGITDVDRILIAGFFVQSKSEDNFFTTALVSKLLQDQGIKPANPADCIAKNKKARRVIVIKKGAYRISPEGEDHINKYLQK